MRLLWITGVSLVGICAVVACDAGGGATGSSGSTGSAQGGQPGVGGGGGSGGLVFAGSGGSEPCMAACSTDFHSVLDCNGNVSATCDGLEGCDPTTLTCRNACEGAVDAKLAVGCEYYATFMDQILQNPCFAAFVANTWNTPAHIEVTYQGAPLPVANFARIPSGSGATLQYNPYDASAGLPPGEVAILFLSGGQGGVACPVPSAVPNGVASQQTTIGDAFRINTDVPVVAYQINPYGGGSAQTTAASLLLSTSVWDTNYVAVSVSPFDIANPSMNIVAREDNTTVEMVPVAAVAGGGGVPAGPANTVLSFTLNEGQHAQISQTADLTGSIIQTDKPVGFMAGQNCMRAPVGTPYCDHGEQMIPPVKALGNEYVGVMYRPRPGESETIYKLVGAVDGTELTFEPDVGGPATLAQGQLVEFTTGTPFVVRSQDDSHPFIMMTYMRSNGAVQDGYGDPDIVVSVPPEQYLNRYVFFADPTYPETSLVVVRAKHPSDDTFRPVTLDCAGELSGWQAVGDYEWTRVDLMTGNFQAVGGCSTGAHEMSSESSFGLWVWGWGTPEAPGTRDVSYGYPGGMNVQPINDVVIPPTPQ